MLVGTKTGVRKSELFSPPQGSAWARRAVSRSCAQAMMLGLQVGFLASTNGQGHTLVPAGFCDSKQVQEKSGLGAIMTTAGGVSRGTPCAWRFLYSLS